MAPTSDFERSRPASTTTPKKTCATPGDARADLGAGRPGVRFARPVVSGVPVAAWVAAPIVNIRPPGREVLVVGAYFADLIFRDLSRPVLSGTEVFARGFSLLPGGAFTLAMAMRRLGHDVVWATDFGND